MASEAYHDWSGEAAGARLRVNFTLKLLLIQNFCNRPLMRFISFASNIGPAAAVPAGPAPAPLTKDACHWRSKDFSSLPTSSSQCKFFLNSSLYLLRHLVTALAYTIVLHANYLDLECVCVCGGRGGGILQKYAISYGSLQAVESETCPSFTEALKAGKPVKVQMDPATLADGLNVPIVSLALMCVFCFQVCVH